MDKNGITYYTFVWWVPLTLYYLRHNKCMTKLHIIPRIYSTFFSFGITKNHFSFVVKHACRIEFVYLFFFRHKNETSHVDYCFNFENVDGKRAANVLSYHFELVRLTKRNPIHCEWHTLLVSLHVLRLLKVHWRDVSLEINSIRWKI